MSAIYQNTWSHGSYIYHTVSSGIDVYNSTASILIDHIPVPDEPSAVWVDDTGIYIGTVNSGVYVASVSGVALQYFYGPDLTSDSTIYLHGAGDYLCISTVSGVDRYTISTEDRIYTQDNYIHKCFQTVSGTVYYIENSRFYNVSENDLGATIRNWNYYQYITCDPTNIDDAQVFIDIPNTFPFESCQPNGEDLRFLTDGFEVMNYYIESWYPSARVVVKVPTAGTTGFYMLYGNSTAPAQSDPGGAYLLHDDFNGTELNTDRWTPVYTSAAPIVQNGYVQFRDNSYTTTGIYSAEKIPYGLAEVKLRIWPINTGRTYYQMGWSSADTSFTSRGHVYIDGDFYNNYHQLYPYYEAMVQGVEEHAISWRTWQFLMSEGSQASSYSSEVLTATGTGLPTTPEYYFMMRESGLYNNGYIEIDYVKITSYPLNETTTSTEQILWDINKPKLHVVYEPSADWVSPDYTYDEFYANPGIINDIHVTSGTVFLGTDRGAHVIEELQGNEDNARKKYFFID